jgi:hypothetical protein
MKHNKFPPDQQSNLAGAKSATGSAGLKQEEVDLAPSPDEVARRAYFCYLNQGSKSGHEVQHWLTAEAELITERDLTRTHSFHNKT